MNVVTVRNFFKNQEERQQLKCLAGGKGLGRQILIPQIQRPGLALTGDTKPINPGRIQILGNSEMNYLRHLPKPRRSQVFKQICETRIPCIIITSDNKIPEPLEKIADTYRVPLMLSPLPTATVIIRTQQFLEGNLLDSTSLHGVCVDVYGVGIVMLGKSGMGKSECALELVVRGHRLVADDIVNIRKRLPSALVAYASETIKYHMEIRGLGIINIKDLFGVSSVRDQKDVELVIEMVEWNPSKEYERLGITEKSYKILDIGVPFIQLPVRPGRSISTIIEVAARNQLLKMKGIHSAQEFQDRLVEDLLANKVKGDSA